MPRALPTPDEMARQADELFMPAFILGLVEPSGPIDDEDRARARRILQIMQTRESLAAYFRQNQVHSAVRMLLLSQGKKSMIDARARTEIASQVESLSISSSPDDISDELWNYIENVRKPCAEVILRSELPKK